MSKVNQFTKELCAISLKHDLPISNSFLQNDCFNLWQAIVYVNRLQYGRNTNRADYRCVIPEQQGTCSTKHALIAALANELAVEINLHIGFFEINQKNTPKVQNILSQHKLIAILEAHCYLSWAAQRFDVTFPEKLEYIDEDRYLYEETIRPEQIGEYKELLHTKRLSDWIDKKNINYCLEDIWLIREQCIQVLSY